MLILDWVHPHWKTSTGVAAVNGAFGDVNFESQLTPDEHQELKDTVSVFLLQKDQEKRTIQKIPANLAVEI